MRNNLGLFLIAQGERQITLGLAVYRGASQSQVAGILKEDTVVASFGRN